jgi:hypothetical protein
MDASAIHHIHAEIGVKPKGYDPAPACGGFGPETPEKARCGQEVAKRDFRDPGRVLIFDTSLRDGEQSPGASMTSLRPRGGHPPARHAHAPEDPTRS